MKASTSLCIISKNEANSIGQCIKSALPYVDQVVVIDTGSSDNTKEIASGLGAEIWDFPWNNDFSAARNFSLDKARCDWIIFMDCDEEIKEGTGEELSKVIETNNYDAYYVNITNILSEDNNTTFQSIRLFRNLPQFKFEGKIHEQISLSIVKHSGQQKIGYCDLTLFHHGYNPEKVSIQAKIIRNFNLLKEAESSLEPPNGFLLYNLGVEYIRQGEFQKALETFIESLKLTKSNAGYAPILANKIIVCLIELKRYQDALEQLTEFQKIYPDYKDLYLLEAACHLRSGRFSLAKEKIERFKIISKNNKNYPLEGTIFGKKPENILYELKNLCTASLKTFKLSVCILKNDDEQCITDCLKSINELADELILITTGCSDNSLNIAYQMGAKIFRLNWDNSFAKLRNFALKQATGDWVIFINGDQVLNIFDHTKLIEELNTSTKLGYYLKLKTFYDTKMTISSENAVCKLFYNKSNIYYSSCLTEDINLSIKSQYGEDSIGKLFVIIYDYGPVVKPYSTEKSFKQNLTLLAKDLKKDGKNNFTYELFGYEFFKNCKYNLALKNFKQAWKLSNHKNPKSLYGIVSSLYNLERFSEALGFAEITNNLFSDYTDLVFLLGCCYLKLEKPEKAKEYLEKCLQLDSASWEKYTTYSGTGNYLAHSKLAEVYLLQNDLSKALQQYQEASRNPLGISSAIPNLTKLIISFFGSERILSYLTENNLDSIEHLYTATETAIKNNCLLAGIELLDASIENLNHQPIQYSLVSSLMFDILGHVFQQAVHQNPHDAKLFTLNNFFK